MIGNGDKPQAPPLAPALGERAFRRIVRAVLQAFLSERAFLRAYFLFVRWRTRGRP